EGAGEVGDARLQRRNRNLGRCQPRVEQCEQQLQSTTGLSGSSLALRPRGGKWRESSLVIASIAATAPSAYCFLLNACSIVRQIALHSVCSTFAAMPRSATISILRSSSCT